MTEFKIPFTIKGNPEDFVLSKLYGAKNEAYSLKIEKRKQLEAPITIQINPTTQDLSFMLTVELEEGAQAVLIEDWSLEVQSDEVNFDCEIVCGSKAELKYVVLNHSSDQTSITERRQTDIAHDAKCHFYAYHFGSKKVESQLQQKASGAKAEVQTDIVARSSQKQNLSFKAEHLYAGKEGSGEIGMKGVAQDKGMLNFDGLVNIAQTGGGSAGYLQQETLNLSPDTIVRAVPGLKIDTNDVKAGHGASVRNLNDEDLYYFGARGIAQEEAKRLLVTGFLGKELARIRDLPEAYEAIRKLI